MVFNGLLYQLKMHDLLYCIQVMQVVAVQFSPKLSQPIYFNNPVIKVGPMYVHRNRHLQDQVLIRQAPANE